MIMFHKALKIKSTSTYSIGVVLFSNYFIKKKIPESRKLSHGEELF